MWEAWRGRGQGRCVGRDCRLGRHRPGVRQPIGDVDGAEIEVRTLAFLEYQRRRVGERRRRLGRGLLKLLQPIGLARLGGGRLLCLGGRRENHGRTRRLRRRFLGRRNQAGEPGLLFETAKPEGRCRRWWSRRRRCCETAPRQPPVSQGGQSNAQAARLPVVWRAEQQQAVAPGLASQLPPAGIADRWSVQEAWLAPTLVPEARGDPSCGQAFPPPGGRWGAAAPPPVVRIHALRRSACQRTSPGVRPSAGAVHPLALRAPARREPKATRWVASPVGVRRRAQRAVRSARCASRSSRD